MNIVGGRQANARSGGLWERARGDKRIGAPSYQRHVRRLQFAAIVAMVTMAALSAAQASNHTWTGGSGVLFGTAAPNCRAARTEANR